MTYELRNPPPSCAANQYSDSTLHTRTFVAFLDANPGVWAVFHTYASKNSASTRRKTMRRQYSHLGYDFTTRHEADGFTVYGRKRAAPLAHTLFA